MHFFTQKEKLSFYFYLKCVILPHHEYRMTSQTNTDSHTTYIRPHIIQKKKKKKGLKN